jgi:flagellar basal-body rod protein FlgF
MSELTEMAMAAISQAQRRVEVAAQNLSNAATPSYKRRVAFSSLVGDSDSSRSNMPQVNTIVDRRPGKFIETANPANLALGGSGFFALRRDDQVIYTRNGQFSVDADGRLVDRNGFALQLGNGRDLVVKSADFKVLPGGVVREKGQVLGTIAVFADVADFGDGESGSTATASLDLVANPDIEQGMIEASNVATGDEMVAMIEALRRAEAGQRVMTIYDDLMGRVITSFGENAR